MPICNSGGADGADTIFGRMAKQAGHTVRHFTFPRYFRNKMFPVEDVAVLQPEQLREADPYLIQANKSLKRRFPTNREEIDNLLRRNYWQIKDTEAVYAVAQLDKGKYVVGGTAWAVQMAIDRGISNVYLFDLAEAEWNVHHLGMGWFKLRGLFDGKLRPASPSTFNVYTGIGSRQLTTEGVQAIEDLYRNDYTADHNG